MHSNNYPTHILHPTWGHASGSLQEGQVPFLLSCSANQLFIPIPASLFLSFSILLLIPLYIKQASNTQGYQSLDAEPQHIIEVWCLVNSLSLGFWPGAICMLMGSIFSGFIFFSWKKGKLVLGDDEFVGSGSKSPLSPGIIYSSWTIVLDWPYAPDPHIMDELCRHWGPYALIQPWVTLTCNYPEFCIFLQDDPLTTLNCFLGF